VLRPDYGDVTAEYLALRSGRAYVADFSEVVWVTGTDAIEFLDGQASQDIAGMVPGETARSFLLEPRGKLVALLWLVRDVDRVGVVVGAGQGAGVIEHLERFRFRVDVDLALDERLVVEIWGSDLSEISGRSGLEEAGWVDRDGVMAALLADVPLSRLLLAGLKTEGLQALGVDPAGQIAVDTVRIEAGEPLMGVDLDESTIPQESGLVDRSVSFTKGCFVGQELVARIDSRGRVNRRLVGVAMSTNLLPPTGSEVIADDVVVGSVSSVGESLAVGAPVALAMVRREVDSGEEVTIRWGSSSAQARVHELPMDDFSEISHFSYTKGRN